MTERQERIIRDALSAKRGSVHFITWDYDVAYINHSGSILVQFCSGQGGDYKKQIRGTDYGHIKIEEAVGELERLATLNNFFRVCWHKQWGDCKCNRIV